MNNEQIAAAVRGLDECYLEAIEVVANPYSYNPYKLRLAERTLPILWRVSLLKADVFRYKEAYEAGKEEALPLFKTGLVVLEDIYERYLQKRYFAVHRLLDKEAGLRGET